MRDLEAKTNVNRETIRIYLRHGLIPEPARPKRNVADYNEEHVRAILAVRDLQKNTGLTLNQIKATLSGDHTNRRVEASAFQNLEELVATRVGIDVKPVLLKAVAKAFPDAPADAKKLESIGVVDIIKTKDGPALSVTDSRLVTIWSEMRQAGFDETRGFVPEMLTYYLEPAESVASQEASLFLERVEGRISEEEAAAMLQIALRLMLDFFGLIHMKCFMANIRDAREKHILTSSKKSGMDKVRKRSRKKS
ncbi:MerR family transcriptional regulator [Hyphococcus sp.]|uniref:MerR family transcriptional regulator n=1 Tax=Hyphococcus sp. TaxID=2038636 RepID=UPI0035C77CB1